MRVTTAHATLACMQRLMDVLRFLLDAFQAFLRQGCASLAASLAFFSLLSLFPLVFLLLYGVSFLVSQDVIGEQFLIHCRQKRRYVIGQGMTVEAAVTCGCHDGLLDLATREIIGHCHFLLRRA